MEKVLVVKREMLVSYINKNNREFQIGKNEDIIRIIHENYSYIDRSDAETNEEYKQIIPYAFLTCEEEIYVLRRLSKQNESRLHDKVSIGVGGHINPTNNLENEDLIQEGLMKELFEEIDVKDSNILKISLVGILNDDTNSVGRVHLGFVYHIELLDKKIEVLEKEKMEGKWCKKNSLKDFYLNMETWSQIIVDNLFKEDVYY